MKNNSIEWLRQQDGFFTNNKDKREFFLDLAEYFETISNDRTLSNCLDEIKERQKDSDHRYDLLIKPTEDKLIELKVKIFSLSKKSSAFIEVKKQTDEFEEWRIFSRASTEDRLWSMYHCLRIALEILEREKVKGYEQYLNEKYKDNPVDQPMWKFHFTMKEYDNQKRNFFIRYQRTIQHAFNLISQVHKALFLRDDFFESADKMQKEFRDKAMKAKQGKAELTTEDFQNYHRFSAFSDEFGFITVMDKIYDGKLDDDKSLAGYLFKKSFKRNVWIRHFLKVNNFLINQQCNLRESIKGVDKSDKPQFEIPSLIQIWTSKVQPPHYRYIGENEHTDKECTSEKQILNLLLFKLVTKDDHKMQAKDAVDYLEKESPSIKDRKTWLSMQSPERRITTYVNDIRKSLPFSKREFDINEGFVFLQTVRKK